MVSVYNKFFPAHFISINNNRSVDNLNITRGFINKLSIRPKSIQMNRWAFSHL